jgi:hypothetical protein
MRPLSGTANPRWVEWVGNFALIRSGGPFQPTLWSHWGQLVCNSWSLLKKNSCGKIWPRGFELSCSWSKIHERSISLRLLGINLRVLRLQFSVYNVYITNQFQTTVAGGGVIKSLVEGTVNSRWENSQDFGPKYVKEFGLLSGVWRSNQRASKPVAATLILGRISLQSYDFRLLLAGEHTNGDLWSYMQVLNWITPYI